MTTHHATLELPGAKLDAARMPGHWLLARLGKRVLRPGGLELTRKMLAELHITSADHVVELAPGLGTTTRMVLASEPASYTGVERDAAAACATQRLLRDGRDQCRQGIAADTGLESASATVVYGEAMLTMQTASQKADIFKEVRRVLRPDGRYGIHELALAPDDISQQERSEIEHALSGSIHVGTRPLTVSEWKSALEEGGFELVSCELAPMHLLEPGRLVADEGLFGALRIAFNILRSRAARQRVSEMRGVFRKYASKMCAVTIVARRKDIQAD